MTIKRQKRSAKLKLKVALEATQEQQTLNQIAHKYGLNLVLVLSVLSSLDLRP